MSATNATNGRPQRKQLSEQLDRFDTLLDGLAEGLNDAIADAVRDGTRLALKDAVIEILTDPTLRSKLQQAAAPERPASKPIPTAPGIFARLKAKVSNLLGGAKAVVTNAASATVSAAKTTVDAVRHPGRLIRLIGNLKRLLLVGASVGVALAAVSLFAPHVVSATLSGVSGGIAAMAVQTALWTRRTIRALSFA